MNEIELWESEIEESSKSHFFENVSRSIDFLSESVDIDSKLLNIDTINEGTIKEFFKTIGGKLKTLVDKFVEFIKGILGRIKDKFGKATSEEKRKIREERANKILKHKNGNIDSSVHSMVKEHIQKSENGYQKLVAVNYDAINKEAQGAQYDLKNINNFINDIKQSLDSHEIKSISGNLKVEEKDQQKDYIDANFDRFFRVININSTGNNIKDIMKNINKIDINTDKGVEALENYAESLLKLSDGYKDNIKAFENYNPDDDKEFSKAATEYFSTLSKFYSVQKNIISGLAKDIFSQKVLLDQISNIYLKEANKGK